MKSSEIAERETKDLLTGIVPFIKSENEDLVRSALKLSFQMGMSWQQDIELERLGIKAEKLNSERSEEELSLEFDKKYENGDFDDRQILDDDLPDFKDNWIAENL